MNAVLKIVLQRMGLGLITLFVVSLIIFCALLFLPGNFANAILGQAATPETVSAFEREIGLDKPPHVRYFEWIAGVLQGDFGTSYASRVGYRREVAEMLGPRAFNTLFLAGFTALIAVPLSVGLGLLAALYRNTWFDRGINMICVTGGPAVARAALKSGKRAVVAGPGNPPVVVDETADLDNAARCIIRGGAYDNNLLCIAEKEVFVVSSVFDEMMRAMERAGAVRLSSREVDSLTKVAMMQVGEGEHKHDAPSKDFLGQDASVLARGAGRSVSEKTELLFGETDEHHPFVTVEQMMPFVPFVRVRDVDEGIDKAKHYEHGFRHTSIIHSNNVRNMTKMGRALDTTLFVKNGPCMAALGLGGEGYLSFSIAGPTGEGVTDSRRMVG